MWKTWFGLIIYYESSTWAFADTGAQNPKICDLGGSFLGSPLGRHFGAFLARFLLHFGTILGPTWAKRAVQKAMEKKVPKKERHQGSKGPGPQNRARVRPEDPVQEEPVYI